MQNVTTHNPNASSRIPLLQNNEPWEPFYIAARLQCLNAETPSFSFPNQDSVFIDEHFLKQLCGSVFGMQQSNPNWLIPQQQYESVKLRRYSSLPQSAWPLFQVQNQNQQIQCTRSRSKPGSGGTGVFLPRHHVETRNKSGFTPVLVPEKVVHALNVTIQSQFSNAVAIDYETLLSTRDTLLMPQQRLKLRGEEVAGYETRLPQEWTY